MGNVGMTLKRFFTNKNTVTLLAIIVCVIGGLIKLLVQLMLV